MAHAKRQQEKQLQVIELREGLIRIKQRLALLKFKHITDAYALLRKALEHADEYHARFMFKAGAKAWFKFYRTRKPLIRACLSKLKQSRFVIKKKSMRLWLSHP